VELRRVKQMVKDKFKNKVTQLRESKENLDEILSWFQNRQQQARDNRALSKREQGTYGKNSKPVASNSYSRLQQNYRQNRASAEKAGFTQDNLNKRAQGVLNYVPLAGTAMKAAQYAGSGKDAYGNKVTAGDVALSAGLDVAGGAIAKGLSGAARGAARLARPATQAVARAVKGAAPVTRSRLATAAKTVGGRLAQKAKDIRANTSRLAANQNASKAMTTAEKAAQSMNKNINANAGRLAANRTASASMKQAERAAKTQQTVMGTERANRQALKSQSIRQAAREAPTTRGAGPAGRGASSQATRAAAQRQAKQQQMIMGTETANRAALKNQAQRQVAAKVAARDAARNATLTRSAGPAGRGGASQAVRAAAQRRNNAIVSKQTNQRNAMSRVQPKPVAGKTSGTPPAARPDLVPGQQAAQVAKTAASVTAGRAAASSVVQPSAQSTASQTSGRPDSARPDKPMGQFQAPSAAAAPKPDKQQVQKVVKKKVQKAAPAPVKRVGNWKNAETAASYAKRSAQFGKGPDR
jgi:hypothetical protein